MQEVPRTAPQVFSELGQHVRHRQAVGLGHDDDAHDEMVRRLRGHRATAGFVDEGVKHLMPRIAAYVCHPIGPACPPPGYTHDDYIK
jgi:hypothetical protein